ncbi:MAG: hypothetical protein AAF762_02630 [Pseudomonadota bacterium]
MKLKSLALGALLLPALAHASGDFGTEEEARSIANQMTAIIQDGGVDAAIAARHDPALPFAEAQMGVHVFEQSIIVADNRKPEFIDSSYAEVEDLVGEAM